MEKLRVLLCDDEATLLEGLIKLFDWEAHGLSPTAVCGDGVMAQNAARELRPDIMLVDINMPLMSGLEVIRTLSPHLPETVFIILSGYDVFEYAQAALKLRVFDYLLKPVRFDELGRVLDQARLFFLQGRVAAPAVPAAVEDEPLLNRLVSYLNTHLAEDISLNRLADAFNLNAAYISQFFKNKTGMNYLKYVTMLRINLAKELLSASEMPVSDVAAATGFEDYRVFTKVFKRQEGVPPSSWRKGTDDMKQEAKEES